MTTSNHVKLTKLAAIQQPAGMLPVEYWTKGRLLEPIEVGKHIVMARYARSRRTSDEPEVVTVDGFFETTAVVEIDGDVVKTRNSHWRVEPVVEEQENDAQ